MFDGNKLRMRRKELKISQQQLGLIISVAQPIISDWEWGRLRRDPHFDMVCRIAAALGVEITFFIKKENQ